MRLLLLLTAVSIAFAATETAVENETVRVLKAVDEPHTKGAMHKHDFNRVMVYLDAGDILVGHPDGSQEKEHWSKNQVAWAPVSGLHTSENIGSAPIRIIEVELKKPGPLRQVRRDPKLDPIAIDPAHNVLLFENTQVRVFRSWREPGGREMMHEHSGAGRVSIMLTNMDARVKLGDGTSSEQHRVAGDVNWSGPVVHATTNVGKNRVEMVVVEVK